MQKFNETFRKTSKDETNKQLKKRHKHYYWLARRLRELVECFGMNNEELPDVLSLYRGIRDHFIFPSLNAFIKGPVSTTYSYAVAHGFCNNKGMILQLTMNKYEWTYRGKYGGSRLFCFDCMAFSDFVSEQEVFTIGGAKKCGFQTLIEIPRGINYIKYIHGMNQMMDSKNKPRSKEEKQIVWRLFCHELYRCYPDHEYAIKYVTLPEKMEYLLHQQCQDVFKMIINGDECDVHKILFRDENGLRLDVILKLFPNLLHLTYKETEEQKENELFTSNFYMSVLNAFEDRNACLQSLRIYTWYEYDLHRLEIYRWKAKFNRSGVNIDTEPNTFRDKCKISCMRFERQVSAQQFKKHPIRFTCRISFEIVCYIIWCVVVVLVFFLVLIRRI